MMIKFKNNEIGIVYVVWGEKILEELALSIESVKKHINLPICVIHDETTDVSTLSCMTKKIKYPSHMKSFSRKIKMFESPFKHTLYLDSDCIILDSLTMAFEKLKIHDICLCHAPLYYFKFKEKEIVHYNSGVLFFSKNETTKKLFDIWEENKNSCKNEFERDQLALAKAIDSVNPKIFLLPPTWNFRPHIDSNREIIKMIHGPIKIWHCRRKLKNKELNVNSNTRWQKPKFVVGSNSSNEDLKII